ncbi:MAG: hypothetical protein Kow0080_25020 [Candidatus Promineifilaceae bacterium]
MQENEAARINDAAEELTETDEETAVAQTNTAIPQATQPSAPPASTTTPTTSLIVWVPPDFIGINDTAKQLFTDQLLTYDAAHPETTIVLEQKTVVGQGGILNYLRTGRNVAPSILPDLIVLPADQVATAASDELIYPLDAFLSETAVTAKLFPAAAAMAAQNEQTYAFPIAITNLTHIAYNPAAITQTLPADWDTLFSSTENSFLFPAAGRQGALLTLQLYLAAGGTLTNEAGQPDLQLTPLIDALEKLSNGRNNGSIPLQSSNLATFDETWQAYRAGSSKMILTTASQFLSQRTDQTLAAAAVPGITTPLIPLVNGWVIAITSPDLNRQALAADLLMTLNDTTFLGEWTQAANLLPASETVLTLWPQDDPYTTFVSSELMRAQPMPISDSSKIMLALGNAVFDVISLSKSPALAAEEALLAIQQ